MNGNPQVFRRDAEKDDRDGRATLISAAELARRFDLSMVGAHKLMRSAGFPHLKIGRHRYTTEPLLAGWMAAKIKNPPAVKCFDPLEAPVVDRALWLIGELVCRGNLAVVDLRRHEPSPRESGLNPQAAPVEPGREWLARPGFPQEVPA